MQSLEKIIVYLKELKVIFSQEDKIVPSVSKAGVYWYSDHALRSTLMMINGLKHNESPKKKWNPIFQLILLLKWIPRGAAKSPKGKYSETQVTKQSLQKLHDELLAVIKNYEVDDDVWFDHPNPMFGDLSSQQTLQFAAIHMYHHLKIIRDINKN